MIEWRSPGRRWPDPATPTSPGRGGRAGPHILVCVPPTGPADHVRLAVALARGAKGSLLIATVVELPRITPYSAIRAVMARRSRRLAALSRDLPGSVPCRHVVVGAHATGRTLVELADRRNVDLAVLGWPRTPRVGIRGFAHRDPVHEMLLHSPSGVCVVERWPSTPPGRILLEAPDAVTLALALQVGIAVLAPHLLRRLPSPPYAAEWSLEQVAASPTSPGPTTAPDEVLEHIVAVRANAALDARSLGERATALGADVLVASALEARGVWPIRRSVPRTVLADAFPGPVVLVRAGRSAEGGRSATSWTAEAR